MGASAEQVAEARALEESPDFEVFEMNWTAVMLFLRLTTQWNVVDGAWLGLNYQSVDFLLRISETTERAKLFSDLQIMEFAAVKALNTKDDD